MKAILLAAGKGERLRPLTEDRPKCMVEYKGKPILEHTLDRLRRAGVTDISVVGGYRYEKIRAKGAKIVRNLEYDSTNMVHSLFCVANELVGDVLISYTDIVYSDKNLKALMESQGEVSILVDERWHDLWCQRMDDPLSDAETLKINDNGAVREIGKKPKSLRDIDAQYMGLIKLSGSGAKKLLAHYEHLQKASDLQPTLERMCMTTLLQTYIDAGNLVEAVPIKGGWLEFDNVSDLRLEPLPQ